MDKDKASEFIARFKQYKASEDYKFRKEQFAITPVFREIIQEAISQGAITNQTLTDLIHIFKFNCTDTGFDAKLTALIQDKTRREQLHKAAYDVYQRGYTNAGKTAVQGLTDIQLQQVQDFLKNAFTIKTENEAIELTRQFDALQIPSVKKGIYSPWLYYINPTIFPIVNNSHNNFKNWLGLSAEYPESIAEFNELSKLTGEPELGAIDYFAHSFKKDGSVSFFKTIYLGKSNVFKISHGIFTKNSDAGHQQVAKILRDRNWICMGRYTKKSQADNFLNAKIGDYVYVCDGGNWLWYLAKITSEWRPLPVEVAELFGDDEEEFIYRETDRIAEPLDASTGDLKEEQSHIMPSGYSTFKQIPEHDLSTANDLLFIPKFNVEFIPGEPEIDAQTPTSMQGDNSKTYTPNTILYGPPGTGKTYNSIEEAVRIANPKFFEQKPKRDMVKAEYDRLQNLGQIEFITFHQSLGYEDFIEGIKPVSPKEEEDVVSTDESEANKPQREASKQSLQYVVQDGIFKQLCTRAAFAFVDSSASPEAKNVVAFDEAYDMLVEDALDALENDDTPLEIPQKIAGKMIRIARITPAGNLRMMHVGGNNKKEHVVSKTRLAKLFAAYSDADAVGNIRADFKKVIRSSNYTAYWAALKAVQERIGQPQASIIADEKKSTREKDAISKLKNDDFKAEVDQRFVLIIDEINRGNVSSIFGELITLLEEDKRLGRDEALRAKLPYSGDDFGVPPNLYVIGTMNTADRSVEALDTALRRRFAFVHKGPQPGLLKPTNDGIDLQQLLAKLNRRLTILVDADHTIGHAWLMGVKDVEGLKDKFKAKILPLLQEYFYNDYAKLGLVLGNEFFKIPDKGSEKELADFDLDDADSSSYSDKVILELKDVNDLAVEHFIRIYDPKYKANVGA